MKVTKWSTFTGGLNVSEQNAEQSSGDSGSLHSGSAGPDIWEAQHPLAPSTPEAVKETTGVFSPDLQGSAAGLDAPTPKGSDKGSEQAAEQATEAKTPEVDVARTNARGLPGGAFMMPPGDHVRGSAAPGAADSEPKQEMLPKRRPSALAAVVALATLAGALGGALATAGLWHFATSDVATTGNGAVEASVARIDADIAALKSSLEHTAKLASAQSGKAGERLDKLEKAQTEPSARLARLSEAVEKLRAASPAATAPAAAAPAAAASVAAKEATGSIPPPTAASKAEVAKLPTVAGWTLRDVANGGALIESRQGLFEVYAGDAVPGLGRIDAIRRQDGRWIVVTAKGLIVTR
jgi:hypothetical protein